MARVITAQEWKEKGNEKFNKGDWSKALNYYTNALKLEIENNAEKEVCYKNRAATYLMLDNYEEVIKDCNSALKICCNKTNPRATISQLLDLVFNVSEDKENRETAMIKLYTFARDETGAEEIFQKEGVSKIAQLVKVEENEKLICNAIYIVRALCKNSIVRTDYVMKCVGLLWCLEMMNSASTERVNASQSCLQTILNIYSGMINKYRPKPDMSLCLKYKSEIYMILSCLLNSVTSRTITGLARDATIEFITRNMHHAALNWAEQLVDFGGLQKLMEVATQLEKHESSLDITSSTRTLISISLAKIYENMYHDAAKEEFIDAIYEFIQDKLLKSDTESKVRGVVAIITLIFGPFKIADAIIFKKGMIEKIFAMAETDDVLQQKVVCECVIAGATKYNKFNEFINKGVNILQKLDKTNNDIIRILAFLGLCKLSKFEKYYVIQPFAGKATDELVKVCRRFLINPQRDMRKWAVEGLSYLTFNIGVKKKLIEDREAVQAIIAFAKTENQSVLYRVDILLLNLCHAYDNKDVLIPEILMFLEYFHLENHILIEDRDVEERRRVLAHAGVTCSALVSLAKTNSQNSKELIAHVFDAICSQEELRKIVVDECGTDALLSLALSGTDKGKKIALQVLVHLALTIPPEVAFSGQMIMQVVRPIFNLLKRKYDALAINILSVLCNLASVNDSMRQHIFNEAGYERLSRILIYSHKTASQRYCGRLRAAELLDNLALNREVAIKFYEHAKAKEVMKSVLDILCFYGDKNKALAGAGVRLTAVDNEYCEKMLDRIYSSDENAIPLQVLLYNSDSNLQYRGVKTVLNMMKSTRKVATKFIETNIIMEQLRELSKNDTVQKKSEELASLALEVAAEWGKLKKNVERNGSSQSTDNIEHSIKKAKCED
ncbi:LOW QUALITY PROTEIN: protein unc-45 homolog B-like [Temnothorax curvispinosus]|uniref:LOW QUALITY PROTEIN: protein unc-45 homolog B-like n=1 Tax=Temnothorax curvispinosus TaxID=300111 RepID=A0A6J1QR63_9HYME|nr:LOW QUALITY PROTEIN: protein unc-45 homolog B-like [Temnothorax curvispinosus]